MSIQIERLSHGYRLPGGDVVQALSDIELTLGEGKTLAIVGATGSGKSTLIQHLNGLLLPTAGSIVVEGLRISAGMKPTRETLRGIRRQVGVVFQYPEQQLFAETVLADVCFGPLAHGLSQTEAEVRARKALAWVGLPESLFERSPFQLSGGQMRRVALAGVLSLQPKYLVLDEPTAGLDPRACQELFALLRRLHREQGMSVTLVSHQMVEVAEFAEQVLVLHQGRMAALEPPAKLFQRRQELSTWGLRAPDVVLLLQQLRQRGWDLEPDSWDPATALRRILAAGKERRDAP